jgi:hypothetical protein
MAMFRQSNKANLRCPGPIDRRTWLKIGGLSLGSLVGGISPTMSSLLAAAASGGGQQLDNDFSVILFWANGGPSHIDLFDLKPEAPAQYRGPFQPIHTNVPGMEITQHLPILARMADKFTIVRSLHHERTEHSGGTNRFLTGYPSVAANLADSEFPEIGSVVAQQLDHRTRDIPLFVANTKFYGGGPAYLGPAFAPYMPRPNPQSLGVYTTRKEWARNGRWGHQDRAVLPTSQWQDYSGVEYLRRSGTIRRVRR